MVVSGRHAHFYTVGRHGTGPEMSSKVGDIICWPDVDAPVFSSSTWPEPEKATVRLVEDQHTHILAFDRG